MKKILISIPFLLIFAISYSQTLTTTGQLNEARWFHQSQLLPNGKVLAFGGDNGDAVNPLVLNTAEVYSPSTETWTNTGTMNVQRTNFASVVLPNGNIMAC